MKVFVWIGFFMFSASVTAQQENVVLSFDVDSIADSITISTFKGYISNIVLTYEDGTEFVEPDSYHLIHFMDASRNSISLITGNAKKIKTISYTLGTDSLINVSGVYSGDLDPINGMYWAWNSGYINLKIEGTKNGNAFGYHIGGFVHPNATAQRISHNLSNGTAKTYTISIDANALLDPINVKELPRIMSPGTKAVQIAATAATTFSIRE